MDFDERTAIDGCRRELACLAAAMERCLSVDGGEDDMVLEHFLRTVERVTGELERIAEGDAE